MIFDTEARLAEIEEEWGIVTDAVNDGANAFVSYEDAVSAALSSVQDDIGALCEAYRRLDNGLL